MPQPADLVKVVTVFDLVNDDTSVAEIAEFAMWGKFATTPTGEALWNSTLQELAQLAVNKWSADIDPTHYSHGAKLWQGDATAHSLPWSSSLVISLYTYTPGSFIAHAGRRRGRVYPPPPNVTVLETTNQGTIHADTALAILNDFKGWLNDFQGVTLTPDENVWVLGVLSKVGNQWNHVTDLAIDTKIDTQRRREKSQQATRQSVAL